MIVMKFGGTSVEDARAMERVIQIVRREQARRPLVVVSAIAGATNALLKSAALALEGNLDGAFSVLNGLLERHVTIAENLIADRPTNQQLILEFKRRIEELRNFCRGIAMLGELTNRSLDAIASAGELLSSKVLAEGMKSRGLKAEFVDARTFMLTDDHFCSAGPLISVIEGKAAALLLPPLERGACVVTQGFIGATEKGITTTLGRGGSDYSAALIGAILGAEEIQIWTDVDGVLSADPRLVTGAQKLNIISFREASELAYFGAKVLHPSTILPAVSKNIPVTVLNSRRPESRGTTIVADPPRANVPVKSIAAKKGITVINIQSTRMLMAYGFLESIFAVFSRHKTPVDLVSTSEVAVSLTIDTTTHLDSVVKELEGFADVTVLKDKAILCVVGEQMQGASGIPARVLRALNGIEIVMISQGASEINMSMAIEQSAADEAVRKLHTEFFDPVPVSDLFEPVRP
jgi:aspartate kinase